MQLEEDQEVLEDQEQHQVLVEQPDQLFVLMLGMDDQELQL